MNQTPRRVKLASKSRQIAERRFGESAKNLHSKTVQALGYDDYFAYQVSYVA